MSIVESSSHVRSRLYLGWHTSTPSAPWIKTTAGGVDRYARQPRPVGNIHFLGLSRLAAISDSNRESSGQRQIYPASFASRRCSQLRQYSTWSRFSFRFVIYFLLLTFFFCSIFIVSSPSPSADYICELVSTPCRMFVSNNLRTWHNPTSDATITQILNGFIAEVSIRSLREFWTGLSCFWY